QWRCHFGEDIGWLMGGDALPEAAASGRYRRGGIIDLRLGGRIGIGWHGFRRQQGALAAQETGNDEAQPREGEPGSHPHQLQPRKRATMRTIGSGMPMAHNRMDQFTLAARLMRWRNMIRLLPPLEHRAGQSRAGPAGSTG